MEVIKNSPINLIRSTNNINKRVGHDSYDHPFLQIDKQQHYSVQSCLPSIQKFNGQGNAEIWLKNVIEKVDLLQLTTKEQHEFIPELLAGDAKIWYFKHYDNMPTFRLFIKYFIQQYGEKELNHNLSTSSISSLIESKKLEIIKHEKIIADCFRNQMLMSCFQTMVTKFSGKSNQSVTRWLKEVKHIMNYFKLKENETLPFIHLCLEGDAKNWFFDNVHLFLIWEVFIKQFITTFELPSKADILINSLHYDKHHIIQNDRISTTIVNEVNNLVTESNETHVDPAAFQQLTETNQMIFDKKKENLHDPNECKISPVQSEKLDKIMIFDKQCDTTSTNIVSEANNIFIESSKTNLDSFDFQQLLKINQITFEKKKILGVVDEFESSTISTEIIDLVPNYNNSFISFGVENTIIIGIKIDFKLKSKQYLLNKNVQPVLSEPVHQVQHDDATQMIITKILMILIIKINNHILNIYWLCIRAFDPGGGNMFTLFIVTHL